MVKLSKYPSNETIVSDISTCYINHLKVFHWTDVASTPAIALNIGAPAINIPMATKVNVPSQ